MKIVFGVLSSDGYSIMKETWISRVKEFNNKHKMNKLDCYFIESSDKFSIEIISECNIFNFKVCNIETPRNIMRKQIELFRYINSNYGDNIIFIRTNLSINWDFEKLIEWLKSFDTFSKPLFCGTIINTYDQFWISGTTLTFNKKSLAILIDNEKYLLESSDNDDVAISLLLKEALKGTDFVFKTIPRIDFLQGGILVLNISKENLDKVFVKRFKSNDRNYDAILHLKEVNLPIKEVKYQYPEYEKYFF